MSIKERNPNTGQLTDIAGCMSVNNLKNLLLDMVYPIDSIYMSVNNVSPANFLGGTWKQLKDRFLLGAGDTYTAGGTGGAATHTLTINEMPSHGHSVAVERNFGGGSSGWSYSCVDRAATRANDYGKGYASNTGGGQAHNNMPPYLTVYMWKRTA